MKNFTFIIVLVFIVLSIPAKAQVDFKLTSELLKAIKEHNDGYEQLNKLSTIIKKMEETSERPETEPDDNWHTLVQNYKNADEDIKAAKLPTDFPVDRYKISAEQFNNCFGKTSNLDILTQYQTELSNAVVFGTQELKTIETEKEKIKSSFAALNYLIDGYALFSTLPIYGGLFTSDLFSLLNTVRPALGEYSASLNNYEKKLRREVDAARLHSSNLQNNINTLRGSFCTLDGVYNGKDRPNGANFSWKHKLNLIRSGNSYTGKFTMVKSNGTSKRESNISNILISGNNIEFNTSWGKYLGRISSDFSNITISRDPYGATYVMSK